MTETDISSLNELPLDDDKRQQFRDLPPSSKLVALVLANRSKLSHKEIAEQTLLPERTVRYGISCLEDCDLVTTVYCLDDARRRLYMVDF
jgi:DNA-binding MarR family transcriptional regulator